MVEAGSELWQRVDSVARESRASGALRTADTECEVVVEDGIPYQLRVLTGFHHKRQALEEQDRTGSNPFLPPDPALLVGGVTATHFAVLNKFNVFGNHLLVVTHAFVEQETLLDRTDFEALAVCMAGIDGLGFYNAGRRAGASQPHRHLQVTPLPMAPATGDLPTPIDGVLRGRTAPSPRATGLPYPHARVALEGTTIGRGNAGRLFDLYHALLAELGLRGPRPLYNLLLTHRWMMIVPRAAERFESISVNALGFAGSLLARDRRGLERIKEVGPGAVLRAVAGG